VVTLTSGGAISGNWVTGNWVNARSPNNVMIRDITMDRTGLLMNVETMKKN
jgi:hypothetical protein